MIHALVSKPDAPNDMLVPVCARGLKAEDVTVGEITMDDDTAISWGYPLCGNCATLIPASWRVKAGHGPHASRAMRVAATSSDMEENSQQSRAGSG